MMPSFRSHYSYAQSQHTGALHQGLKRPRGRKKWLDHQHQLSAVEVFTDCSGKSENRNSEKGGVLGRVTLKTQLGLPAPHVIPKAQTHPFKAKLHPQSDELLVPEWFT